jgi:hypothetical protein
VSGVLLLLSSPKHKNRDKLMRGSWGPQFFGNKEVTKKVFQEGHRLFEVRHVAPVSLEEMGCHHMSTTHSSGCSHSPLQNITQYNFILFHHHQHNTDSIRLISLFLYHMNTAFSLPCASVWCTHMRVTYRERFLDDSNNRHLSYAVRLSTIVLWDTTPETSWISSYEGDAK